MHDTSAYVNLTSLVMPPMTLWSPFFSGGEEAEGVGAEPNGPKLRILYPGGLSYFSVSSISRLVSRSRV
jgi:hypothetical protein